MSNFIYNNARQLFLQGGMNWSPTTPLTFKALLVNASYTGAATDVYRNAIADAYVVGAEVVLTSLTSTGGAAGAATVTFNSVPTGPAAQSIVIYNFVTTEANSPLIAYIDTATGLPITPNGGNIIITWDTGINQIFRL